MLKSLAALAAVGAIGITAWGGVSEADSAGPVENEGRSTAGITYSVTYDLSCLEAQVVFDVNEHTESVGLTFQILDSSDEIKVPWATHEVRNVSPSSTGHEFTASGLVDGDQIIFALFPYDEPDAGGSLGPAPKVGPQPVTDCM